MAKSVVTPERFAKGRTFDEYVQYAGSAENLAREAFGGGYFADGGSMGGPRRDNSAILRERYAQDAAQRAADGGHPMARRLSPAARRRSS